MRHPIPSYLVALVVGNLASAEIGPRCVAHALASTTTLPGRHQRLERSPSLMHTLPVCVMWSRSVVWTEPAMLEACRKEFEGITERYLAGKKPRT